MRAITVAAGAWLVFALAGPARAEDRKDMTVVLTWGAANADVILTVTDSNTRQVYPPAYRSTPGPGQRVYAFRDLPPLFYQLQLRSAAPLDQTVNVDVAVRVTGEPGRTCRGMLSRFSRTSFPISFRLGGLGTTPAPGLGLALPGDLVISLTWQQPGDIDISVQGPGNRYFGHDRDILHGPATETCTIRDPIPGDYRLDAYVYSSCGPGRVEVTGEALLGGRRRGSCRTSIPGGSQRSVVHTFKIGKGGNLPVSDAPPPSRASLAKALAELAGKLPGAGGTGAKAGVVVKVVRKRVYVALGSADGVQPGAELEAAGKTGLAAGGAAGRLRVTSVQEKLCVCERAAGTVEEKNAQGEPSRVVLAGPALRKTAVLGLRQDADGGPEAARSPLADALLAASQGTPGLTIVAAGSPEAQANVDYVLQVEPAAAEAGQGPALLLQLRDPATQNVLTQAKLPCAAAAVSLAELGFQSALAGRFPDRLAMDQVEDAVGEKFGVREARSIRLPGAPKTEWPLFIAKAGAQGASAWVFPDGLLLVASPSDLSTQAAFDALRKAWWRVAAAVAPEPVPTPRPKDAPEAAASDLVVTLKWAGMVDLDLRVEGPGAFGPNTYFPTKRVRGSETCSIANARPGDYTARVHFFAARTRRTSFSLYAYYRSRLLKSFADESVGSVDWTGTFSVGLAPPTTPEAAEKDDARQDETLRKSAAFYTAAENQCQYLYVEPPSPAPFEGWVLEWPKAKADWASLARGGCLFAPGWWTLDGQPIGKITTSGDSTDLTLLEAGRRTLSGRCPTSRGWMTLAGFFPKPTGKIGLQDKAGNSVVTAKSFSLPIAGLTVPACDAYAKK